jgi:hypothetical protein
LKKRRGNFLSYQSAIGPPRRGNQQSAITGSAAL